MFLSIPRSVSWCNSERGTLDATAHNVVAQVQPFHSWHVVFVLLRDKPLSTRNNAYDGITSVQEQNVKYRVSAPKFVFQVEQKEEESRDRAVGFHFQEVGIVTTRAKNPVGEKTIIWWKFNTLNIERLTSTGNYASVFLPPHCQECLSRHKVVGSLLLPFFRLS